MAAQLGMSSSASKDYDNRLLSRVNALSSPRARASFRSHIVFKPSSVLVVMSECCRPVDEGCVEAASHGRACTCNGTCAEVSAPPRFAFVVKELLYLSKQHTVVPTVMLKGDGKDDVTVEQVVVGDEFVMSKFVPFVDGAESYIVHQVLIKRPANASAAALFDDKVYGSVVRYLGNSPSDLSQDLYQNLCYWLKIDMFAKETN